MQRTFQAPAEAVFDAWTSEEVMRRWWHASHDWETTGAEVDLRVGGRCAWSCATPMRTWSTAAVGITPRSTGRAAWPSRGSGTATTRVS